MSLASINIFMYVCVYMCVCVYTYIWASLVAQMVKNSPAMQETWVWFLGQEDALKKQKATHSSIFAWRIPWTEEFGRLQFTGSQRVRHDWTTNTYIFLFSLCLYIYKIVRASLIAQLVKNLSAMQETLFWFQGREDPLEKGLATHSNILGLPLWLSW